MTVMKGLKGLNEAEGFITAFPLSVDAAKETVLSTTDFDLWAAGDGYYTLQCEQATLLDNRNRLKKKINLTASSPAWLALKKTPFFIAVGNHGVSYRVQRTEDAFSITAQKLPRQVKSYAVTKRNTIRALLHSINLQALPPAWQMRIESFDREIERYLRGIDYQTQELNREYLAIQKQLQGLVDAHMLTADEAVLSLIEGKDDLE